ncbi:hypothetical protein Tco_0204459 [Tanacetum coccineum]
MVSTTLRRKPSDAAYILVLEDSYFPCVEQPYDDLENGNLDIYEPRHCCDEYERMFAEAVILIDNRLVKLIDITLEHWLDLKFGNHKKVDIEIKEGVVDTWLIRSYRKQFEEYMEINGRLEVNGVNNDVEYDTTNVDFSKWLASKFNNHMTMDWYTKNALWLYYKRGDNEEVLTYDELSNLEKENLGEERFDNHEPMDDDDIKDSNDYLIPKDAPYYVDEEEKGFKERRSKLLGIPYKKPPMFKSEKFKVIKYSFGPAEEYVSIREYEYDLWVRIKENVSNFYQDIFDKKDEGWFVTKIMQS